MNSPPMTDNPTSLLELAERSPVTAEMIEAGKAALWPVEVPPWEDSEEVVRRVYRAMASARAYEQLGV